MNKLLRQFEKESGLEIYGLGKDRAKWEAALEKYAELIVQECALTAGLMEHEGRTGIGAQILDNFGVES
jgi:hypothetical protein